MKKAGRTARTWRVRLAALLAFAGALAALACAVSQKTRIEPTQIRPALTATRDALLEKYNAQARAVKSINAGVELNPVAGSAYTGLIEDYRDVKGFILAERPAYIRVIGQAPVVAKNVFDMTSDGREFRVYIPSKNKFIEGPTDFERKTEKPIERLRPQHLVEAIFWSELPADSPVLFEELDASPFRYYVLTALRGAGAETEIARKVWFDRAALQVARIQVYGPGGRMESDIAYTNWQPPAGARNESGLASFPWQITVRRPQEDYSLGITITKLRMNEEIPLDRFELKAPAGVEIVRLGEKE